MQLLFIKQLVDIEIVKAICWTLVHSLWQGLLLAIAGGLVILFTRKRQAAVRYNLLSVLFAVFIIASTYTFVCQLKTNEAPTTSSVTNSATTQFVGGFEVAGRNISTGAFLKTFTENFTVYFNNHAPLIVVAWFIILSARLVRILSGLKYINRIRHRKVYDPAAHWTQKLGMLQLSVGIEKRVQLLESGIIKVPMAVGWLKPVILVPMGLFAHLPAEQVEAILLHELAHIKRRDYFINLLQSFAETIFFFNPAVLWISSLIREERENCCDDIAIAITQNKTKFINALVSFQEYNVNGYAMAFPGKKNQLLNRVRRIIHNSNNTLNSFEKAGIISCCLAMILLSAFIVPSDGNQRLLKQIEQFENKLVISDATFQQETMLKKSSKTSTVRLPVIKAPSTNKRSVFDAASLTIAIAEPLQDTGQNIPQVLRADTIPLKNELILQNITLNPKINIDVDNKILINNLVNLSPHVGLENFKLNINLDKLDKVNAKLQLHNEVNLNTNINITKPSLNINVNIDSLHIAIDSSFNRQRSNRDSSRKNNKTPRTNATPHPNPLADLVIVALIKAKVVDEKVLINNEDFYYVLDNNKLIVQGVRQADKLYQELKAKYIKPTGNTTRSYVWVNQ